MVDVLLPFLASALVAQTPITKKGDAFFVGGEKLISFKRSLPDSVAYNVGSKYAVWDRRGLTVRFGSKVVNSRFPDFPTHPKFFNRNEIRENLKLLRSGLFTRNASALSGSTKIGNRVYFLVRWTQRGSSAPWIEAIVEVDFEAKNPEMRLIQRLIGTTVAEGQVDSELFTQGNKLGALVRTKSEWGYASVNPKSGITAFVPLGKNLVSYRRLFGTVVAFVERTPQNTYVVGRTELGNQFRRDLMETTQTVYLLPSPSPLLAVLREGKDRVIRNVDTGAEAPLPREVTLYRGREGVLVVDAGRAAKYLAFDRLNELASWKK